MHPSPSALVEMSDADLETYREELRVQSIETDEDFNGACRARMDLIDGILGDRRRGPKDTPPELLERAVRELAAEHTRHEITAMVHDIYNHLNDEATRRHWSQA